MTEQELKDSIFDEVSDAIHDNRVAGHVEKIWNLLKEVGYVKLSPGQGLPNTPGVDTPYEAGMIEAQQDMLKANFRKVEL